MGGVQVVQFTNNLFVANKILFEEDLRRLSL